MAKSNKGRILEERRRTRSSRSRRKRRVGMHIKRIIMKGKKNQYERETKVGEEEEGE